MLVGFQQSSWRPCPLFNCIWISYLSVGALIVQLALNPLLLFREFARRLSFAPARVGQ